MRKSTLILGLILLSITIATCQVARFQGFAKPYSLHEEVPLKVSKIASSRTALPFDYYSLKFCKPAKVKGAESLGEVFLGERIETSAYTVEMRKEVDCALVCPNGTTLTHKDVKEFQERIQEEYRVYWYLDELPGATPVSSAGLRDNKILYEDGFLLGRTAPDGELVIHNHVTLRIKTHKSDKSDAWYVVFFEVAPKSVLYKDLVPGDAPTDAMGCNSERESEERLSVSRLLKATEDKQTAKVWWTYSVRWTEDPEVTWADRWDAYLVMQDVQIHWFSIINSLMIILFLTGMVAMILIRTLRSDLRRYNVPLDQEEIQEETGWKLLHGDVFRPPRFRMLLSVLCGTGIQIFCMYLVTSVFAVLGFLSPEQHGALQNAIPVLFVFMGCFGGYFSAATYKATGGTHWKRNTLMTALLLPGIVFGVLVVLNIFLAAEGSSAAIDFKYLFMLMALWLLVSVSLVFLGSYFGYKRPAIELPTRTNLIPRLIPEQVWYMKPIFAILMGGILPFGVVFIELFFILTSIWQHQFYYLFTFLFIVFLILVLTCAEITIVMCYFQLCSEDYHWWWRSFLTSGASAFYMFAYAIFYYFTRLHIIGFVSTLLYFGYTFIMALSFFCLTGAIGFYSCAFFVLKIYGALHLS